MIIRQCPPPRIAHSIQRLGDAQMNPEVYSQQYGGSLVDSAEIIRQVRSVGLPANIVSTCDVKKERF